MLKYPNMRVELKQHLDALAAAASPPIEPSTRDDHEGWNYYNGAGYAMSFLLDEAKVLDAHPETMIDVFLYDRSEMRSVVSVGAAVEAFLRDQKGGDLARDRENWGKVRTAAKQFLQSAERA